MQSVVFLTAPWREPAQVLAGFADEPWTLGLVSGGDGPQARWSYVARDPDRVLVVSPDDPSDPFEALATLISPPAPTLADGPPFQGGVAGLCAYELGARAEGLRLDRLDGWPDLAVARYPAILAFDRAEGVVIAIGRGPTASFAEARAHNALGWLDRHSRTAPFAEALAAVACEPPECYEAAVADLVERIAHGEIFQANIARRWRGRLAKGARPFDLFQRLIGASPAPFASYLRLPDRAVVSNSPERFVSVTPTEAGLIAQTRPIKGTMPRGRDPDEDARHAQTLAASPKDRAENLMIVDLMRNDLSRVCRPGTVGTPELWRLETFANVHHLVSTVTGELQPGKTAVDLLAAALPAGSITGAPKVQAMKVIAGHEAPRGPFFGSMFWAGLDGALDSSVLIRTAAFTQDGRGWAVEARAGGGIVADSQPAAERRETEAKIGAILKALENP